MKKYGNDWRKDKRLRSYRLLRTDSDGSESWYEFKTDEYLVVPEALGIFREMTFGVPHWSFEEGNDCVMCGELGPVWCGEGAAESRRNFELQPDIVWFSDK